MGYLCSILPNTDSIKILRAVDFQCDQVETTAAWRGKLARLSLTFQAWVTVAATLEQDEARLVIFRNVLLIRAVALSC